MGGILHKMALGGHPHFFVLINGMSFVRVGVRTESMCLHSVWSFLLHSTSHDGGLSQDEEEEEEAQYSFSSSHCVDCTAEAGVNRASLRVRSIECSPGSWFLRIAL